MSVAKDYLMVVYGMRTKIKDLQAQVDDLADMLLRITPVMDDKPHGGSSAVEDKTAECIARKVDLEAKIAAMIGDYMQKVARCDELLAMVKNGRYHSILSRRYIQMQSFDMIAREMQYSLRQVTRLHGRALQIFEQILIEEGEV